MGVFDTIGSVLGINDPVNINAPKPTGFTSAGATASVNNGNVNVTRSGGMQSLLDSLKTASGNTAGQLASLRSQLSPGFGKLTAAATSSLENKRRATIGNLRDNLARRRVLGSSFAADSLSRADAEFAKQEAEIRAQTGLQELQATIELMQQEHQTRMQSFNAIIQQNNFESALGSGMAEKISEMMNSNAQLQAQMQAQADAGTGQLIGGLIGGAAGLATGNPALAVMGAQAGASMGG